MSRILLAGVGPLPSESGEKLFATGLRVWFFAETLTRAGHEVLIALGQFGQSSETSLSLYRAARSDDSISCEPSGEIASDSLANAMLRAASDFQPDAIVATTDIMAEAAVLCGYVVPVWIDFNGPPMVERQQQSALHAHDGGLAAAWRTILPALLGGDAFSTCSDYQRLALIGELGACGRLNHLTAGHELVHNIPPGNALTSSPAPETRIRGTVVPADAFVVLWTGGFNTWADTATLHKGLLAAMDQNEKIHFVSTGGAIPGHCESVYPQFQTQVAKSRHADRFHLLGWVELDVVRSAWREADLAINIDVFSYEGLLGMRNRMFDWMREGLPIATTVLCELSRILAERSLVYPFTIGDAEDLYRMLLRAASQPDERHNMAQRARDFLLTEWTNERLLAPLLVWAEAPAFAPDLQSSKVQGRVPAIPENSLAAAQKEIVNATKLHEKVEWLSVQNDLLRRQLDRLQGSRFVRSFMRLKNMPVVNTVDPLSEDHK